MRNTIFEALTLLFFAFSSSSCLSGDCYDECDWDACSSDSECAGGDVCFDGGCVPACVANGCADGYVCADTESGTLCVETVEAYDACEVDAQCPDSGTCVEGTCTRVCNRSEIGSPCADGVGVCSESPRGAYNGICRLACQDVSDCSGETARCGALDSAGGADVCYALLEPGDFCIEDAQCRQGACQATSTCG